VAELIAWLATPAFAALSGVVLSFTLTFLIVMVYVSLRPPEDPCYAAMRRFDLLVFALFSLFIGAHLLLLVR
jgi:hypothetical protein